MPAFGCLNENKRLARSPARSVTPEDNEETVSSIGKSLLFRTAYALGQERKSVKLLISRIHCLRSVSCRARHRESTETRSGQDSQVHELSMRNGKLTDGEERDNDARIGTTTRPRSLSFGPAICWAC